MDEFVFYPDDSEILETFQVIRIGKQIGPFVFSEKLWLNNFVSRSTDL